MPLPPRAIASNACWPQANVRVNGDRPRDLQVRDERFFARVLFQLPLHTVGGNRSPAHADPWIARYVFPNALRPSAARLAAALSAAF